VRRLRMGEVARARSRQRERSPEDPADPPAPRRPEVGCGGQRAAARGAPRGRPPRARVLPRCAAPRPVPSAAVPIAPGQAVELARRWAAEWESFPGIRAATDLTIKNRRRTERAAALLLVSPAGLRLEVAP